MRPSRPWLVLPKEYLLPSYSLGSAPEMLCDLRHSQNFWGLLPHIQSKFPNTLLSYPTLPYSDNHLYRLGRCTESIFPCHLTIDLLYVISRPHLPFPGTNLKQRPAGFVV